MEQDQPESFLSSSTTISNLSPLSAFERLLEEWQKKEYTLQDLPELSNAMKSDDKEKQHFGVIGILWLVNKGFESESEDLIIQEMIDAGLIPHLVAFAERYEEPKLQHEAVWALATLTSGTPPHFEMIISKGGIAVFARLLKHENPEICEHAIFALGNLAIESIELRDDILKANAIPLLLDIVEKSHNPLLIKQGIWALTGLIRSGPTPDFALVQEIIPIFSKIVQETQELEDLGRAAWVLSDLTDQGASLMLGTNICLSIVAQIKANHAVKVLAPLLRLLGNLLAGTQSERTEVLKTPDVVDVLVDLATSHEKSSIVEDSCLCLSNITAGNSEQIQMVMKNKEQITNLMKLSQRTELNIANEVLEMFSNATYNASSIQMIALDKCNILDYFYKYLNQDDTNNIILALDGILNFLNMGAYLAIQNKTDNIFLKKFEDKGGIQVENLMMHENHEVNQRIVLILESSL